MRGACLVSGEGYADNEMSKRTVARFFAYFRYIICKDFDKNANEKIGGEDDVVEIGVGGACFGKMGQIWFK